MLLKGTKSLGLYKNCDYGDLGVIIPFKYNKERPEDISKIENILSINRPSGVLLYIVDCGSPSDIGDEIKRLCKKYDTEYVYYPGENEIFSIGKARDVGVMYAKTEFVFFQDVDLVPYEGFYSELLAEIENQNLRENFYDFLMVPCLYLTPEGSEEFLSLSGKDRKSQFINYYINKNVQKIQNYAPGTSAIVVNRFHYLSVGGHRKEFSGHGFEDFELIHRLAAMANRFYRPHRYYTDYKSWDTYDYTGFRSMFRLFGDSLMIKGIFLCHIWHPPYSVSSAYRLQNKNNSKLLCEFMKEFDTTNEHPQPLIDIYMGRTLALGGPKDAFHKSLWQIKPLLGDVEYKSEHEFHTVDEFIDYLNKNKFDRVFMPNPYGNEKRLSIYKELRKRNIKYIVSDRGALTDSVFFDENGFNADSASYDPKIWDRELSDEEELLVDRYIEQEIFSDETLESQGERVGKLVLAEKYGIKHTNKVLFVPFQRPSDTVVKYFSGSVKDMDDFVNFVERVADLLDDSWKILAKKHPLEITSPKSSKITMVDDDTHIKDLLDIADAVLLINSGVGVLSMMWGKPVLYVGEAFYKHEKINVKVNSPEEAVEVLNKGFSVDMKVVKRFIHYLIAEFYSFGKVTYEKVIKADGSYFNVTRNIRFYQVAFPGYGVVKGQIRSKPYIPITSPLFDRYRVYLNSAAKNGSENKKVNGSENKNVDSSKNKNLQNKNNLSDESNLTWFVRQVVKLFLNPMKFIFDFKRWIKKKWSKMKLGLQK